MSDLVFELFDEFAIRHARGEHPDPVEYLDRAGDQEAELADLLDVFLEWAPTRTADPSALLMMNAWLAGEPPLVALRVDRGVRVDDVVEELAEQLELVASKRTKVRRYTQRLEQGFLDPGRVDRRVFEILASRLGVSWSTLSAWASPPLRRGSAAEPAVMLRSDDLSPSDSLPSAPMKPVAEDWDEVDEIFLGSKGA